MAAYYLVVVNGDGRAEVLKVPPGDDPNFIASHYSVLDIYQTQAQAVERCRIANDCADKPAVE